MYPVRIHLVHPSKVPDSKENHCTTQSYERDGKLSHFRIWIANNQSEQGTADSLADEWAHVLRWHIYLVDDGPNGHDAIYGAIYNEIKEKWLHGEE